VDDVPTPVSPCQLFTFTITATPSPTTTTLGFSISHSFVLPSLQLSSSRVIYLCLLQSPSAARRLFSALSTKTAPQPLRMLRRS
jgi:hypothetical protein